MYCYTTDGWSAYKLIYVFGCSPLGKKISIVKQDYWNLIETRPTLERRKTLGHLRSINPNMINHYANQSQTCQLLKIAKNIFFSKQKIWKVVQSISGWTDIENPYRLSRGRIYKLIDVEFLASHFNNLSKFTGWAIIEEVSIRRRPRTFLVSWGQKTCVKYCYVDLSSWYGFWFAIICINMNAILDFSIAIQQLRDIFGC